MENLKIGMLAVSLLLNLLLFNEVRKQSAANSLAVQSLSTQIAAAGNSARVANAGSGGPGDQALMNMVNQAVREEMARYGSNTGSMRGNGSGSSMDSSRLIDLQKRVEEVQKKIADKTGSAGKEKEKRMMEEAAKIKQEVLALCVRK